MLHSICVPVTVVKRQLGAQLCGARVFWGRHIRRHPAYLLSKYQNHEVRYSVPVITFHILSP